MLNFFNKCNLSFNYDLGSKTWFGTGGKCLCFITSDSERVIRIILKYFKKIFPVFIIGAGSNLIVRDGGINGIVIKLGKAFSQITLYKKESILQIGGSAKDHQISKFCLENNITGFEFLSGIPGTLGGNLKMNAGCYGQEIKDKLLSVVFYDLVLKKHFEKPIYDLDFKYRRGFQQDNTVILYGRFKKEIGEQESIKKTMKEYEEKRNLSQPQRVNCCGSIFKNPENMNAWKLIKSSLNDSFYNGPVKLSKKHSNFFENDPDIEADLIEQFIINVQHKVKQKYNLVLDPELKIIG